MSSLKEILIITLETNQILSIILKTNKKVPKQKKNFQNSITNVSS